MDTKKLMRVRKLFETGAARAIRESAGLSLKEASAPAGVHKTTLHRWETGSRRPRGEAAIRYLSVLEDITGA
jgi:DNA-binding transcriptional regulator YiaG